MNHEEQDKKINQIIAKSWADEGFKQKLLADAAAALKAEGMEFPAGMAVHVVENTDKVFYLVIPAKPKDLSEEELEIVAGGGVWIPPTNAPMAGPAGTQYTIKPRG